MSEFTYTIKGVTLNADDAKAIHLAYQWFLDAAKINRVLELDDMELAYRIARCLQDGGWSYKEDLWGAIESCTHEYPDDENEDIICTNPELFDILGKKFNKAIKEGRIL